MMNDGRDSRQISILLQSMWSWDLWIALLVGLLVMILSSILDFQPKREWIAPVFVLSCIVLPISITQRTNFRNRMRGSDYGELLGISDEAETKARMPYTVAIWVTLASIACSGPVALTIEAVCAKWAITTILAVVSTIFAWSFMALLSIVRLSALHDKHEARLQHRREALESAQRQYEAEQRRKNL